MRLYRFSFGDSESGAVSVTAAVAANSRAEAVARLKVAMADAASNPMTHEHRGAAFAVELNSRNVGVEDIVDDEPMPKGRKA